MPYAQAGSSGPAPNAATIPYAAGDSEKWPDPAPNRVAGALDGLAEREAVDVPFSMGTPGNWPAPVDNAAAALDALAAILYQFGYDLSDPAYAPAESNDWNVLSGGTLPSKIKQALDVLAARVRLLELLPRWKTLSINTDFVAQPATSASTLALARDLTATLRPGMLVEIAVNTVDVHRYRVRAVTSSVLTVQGPDLPTGFDQTVTAVRYHTGDPIAPVVLPVRGNWCDALDTGLLEHDEGYPAGGFRYPGRRGLVLGMSVVARLASSSPAPEVQLRVDGSYVGLPVYVSQTAAFVGVGSELAIDEGDLVELACTSAVASGNADLFVVLWVLPEGAA
jgi:hypothetical protein